MSRYKYMFHPNIVSLMKDIPYTQETRASAAKNGFEFGTIFKGGTEAATLAFYCEINSCKLTLHLGDSFFITGNLNDVSLLQATEVKQIRLIVSCMVIALLANDWLTAGYLKSILFSLLFGLKKLGFDINSSNRERLFNIANDSFESLSLIKNLNRVMHRLSGVGEIADIKNITREDINNLYYDIPFNVEKSNESTTHVEEITMQTETATNQEETTETPPHIPFEFPETAIMVKSCEFSLNNEIDRMVKDFNQSLEENEYAIYRTDDADYIIRIMKGREDLGVKDMIHVIVRRRVDDKYMVDFYTNNETRNSVVWGVVDMVLRDLHVQLTKVLNNAFIRNEVFEHMARHYPVIQEPINDITRIVGSRMTLGPFGNSMASTNK